MSKKESISIALQLFKGREDYFAQQGKDYYYPVNRALDEYYLTHHFNGNVTLGIYILTKESYCHLLCVDIDLPKNELSNVNLHDRYEKYTLLSTKLNSTINVLHDKLNIPKESILLEDTGGRGYHIWLILSKPIPGTTAVAFGQTLKGSLDFEIEFFPKQGRLTKNRLFGNLIKLPLGVHRKYQSRSKFITIESESPVFIDDLYDNLVHLSHVTPIDSLDISNIEGFFQGELIIGDEILEEIELEKHRSIYIGDPSILLSNCTALKNISNKAKTGEQLTHFEAFNFANVMLSVQGGINEIHDTMRLSLGQSYSPAKTNAEIARIIALHPSNCKTLVENNICPNYCKPYVKLRNEDPLELNTTPCSVWLKREKFKKIKSPGNIIEILGNKRSIHLAFLRLKQYYIDEITHFFDQFDFAHFSKNIHENCKVISLTFAEKLNIPFSGYFPFRIPKKLDDSLNLQFRTFAYSTVYDQVSIQAVFDALGPYIDSTFHKSSYGYRWNKDENQSYRIFEDWRLNYPRFRNDIINSLKEYPNGYYICCDIKGYFDHIDQDILLQQLQSYIDNEFIYMFIERVLQNYEFEDSSKKGLPQGLPYSGLLANLYLNQFDYKVSEIVSGYFRYVDDFILVFDSFESANKGIEIIVKELLNLGLELSSDEDKKPEYTPNSDISRARKTMEKIQYGILEKSRHIKYLSPDTINDFYNAIERQSFSSDNFEQLIKINYALPTLLYVVSQESLIPHPLRSKILSISEYLIRRSWFFPKRLYNVFNRLFELQPEKHKFVDLFDYLESAHKVYFILNIYEKWKSEKSFENIFIKILRKSLIDNDSFVKGLSISIVIENKLLEKVGASINSILNDLLNSENQYEINRFVGSIDYLSLSLEEKGLFRKLVNKYSPDFTKILLLSNLSELPVDQLDQIYLQTFLTEFHPILLPSVASLLGIARNQSLFFKSLLDFITLEVKFKSLAVILVLEKISKRISSVGILEIENLHALYKDIGDPELERKISLILNRHSKYEDNAFKSHRLLQRYNNCYFYEHIEDIKSYSHLELIPERLIKDHIQYYSINFFDLLDTLALSEVIPPVNFFYDSETEDIGLQYQYNGKFETLNKENFSIESTNSIILALKLASDAFKKASFFKRKTNKTPLVSIDNLLLDIGHEKVVFRSIGKSLQTPFIISFFILGENVSDISYMIAILIKDLLFDNDNHYEEHRIRKHHNPLKAFTIQFIENMSGKEPSRRYSASRFQYLTDRLILAHEKSEPHIAVLYLRERLRSALFRFNQGKVTWHGVCGALDEHAAHVQLISHPETIQKLRIKNHLFASKIRMQRLHYLSYQLLNLTLNRRKLGRAIEIDSAYADLLEYLLLIGVICLELTSLSRSMYVSGNLTNAILNDFMTLDRIPIKAANYEFNIDKSEISEILMYKPDETGLEIKELTLRSMAFMALLCCGTSLVDGSIRITKPAKISQSNFDDFVHACLFRIPNIEKELRKHIENQLFSLLQNDDPIINLNLLDTHENIEILAKDFFKFRNKVRLKRQFGISIGKKFPENITCVTRFRRRIIAEINSLPGIHLTDSYPSSKNRCSWDVSHGKVNNIIIPSPRMYTILESLTKGRFFGYRFSYFYSGKTMILLDFVLFIIVYIFLSLFIFLEGLEFNNFYLAIFASGSKLFSILIGTIFLKLLYDLAFWITPLSKLIVSIRRSWEQRYIDIKE